MKLSSLPDVPIDADTKIVTTVDGGGLAKVSLVSTVASSGGGGGGGSVIESQMVIPGAYTTDQYGNSNYLYFLRNMDLEKKNRVLPTDAAITVAGIGYLTVLSGVIEKAEFAWDGSASNVNASWDSTAKTMVIPIKVGVSYADGTELMYSCGRMKVTNVAQNSMGG